MTRRLPVLLIFTTWLLFTLLIGIPGATAQYMFLDVDGDGVYTGADNRPPSGSPSTIDLYLVTDRNLDGSPAACSDGTLDMLSYTVNLLVSSAAASFTNVTNHMPGMFEVTPLVTYPYALSVGYGGTTLFPPGKYRLMSVTVAFQVGCPSLFLVPSSCYSPTGVVTSFGTPSCPGRQGDYVLRMAEDWMGGWGFSCTDPLGPWPDVTCPGEVEGVEGQPLTIPVTLFASDCDIFSFWVWGLPPGATFSGLSPFVAGEATGTISWTPATGQAGTYTITFDASEYPNPFHGVTQRDTCPTRITIRAVNAPPVADVGGPYAGVQGVPVAFDGTGSSDPEGGPLEFLWDFGDGAHATDPSPTHAYGSGGTYVVTLTVTDPGGLSDQDGVGALITGVLPVRVFTTAGNQSTRLPNGKPHTCFQIEPLPEAPFALEEIVQTSVRLRCVEGPCSAQEATPDGTKWPRIDDTDQNGAPELEACFTRESLATLVSGLSPRANAVRLELSGLLANGDRIHGQVPHTFIMRSGSPDVTVLPNPLSARSVLEFATTEVGFARARLFDIHGRLVATLMDERSIAAGVHRVPLGGSVLLRVRPASGIYFVVVTTEHDGSERRAVTILR